MRFLTLAALLPLAACGFHSHDRGDAVAPSGTGSTRTFQVADFTGVELRGSDDVDVKVGGSFSVTATGDSALLDKLEVVKDGSTLRIGRKSGFSFGDQHLKISVTMPAIQSASVAGSGDLTVDTVKAAKFNGSTAGSGDLSIASLTADDAKLEIAGSGNISASGTAKQLYMAIAGSGDIDAKGVTATAADVSIAGSGSVAATVDGAAKVSMMGSGDVDLGPKANCSVSKMGSGDVTCGNMH